MGRELVELSQETLSGASLAPLERVKEAGRTAWFQAYLPGDLDGMARLLVDGDGGWQYAFELHHRGALLAQGRAAVMPR